MFADELGKTVAGLAGGKGLLILLTLVFLIGTTIFVVDLVRRYKEAQKDHSESGAKNFFDLVPQAAWSGFFWGVLLGVPGAFLLEFGRQNAPASLRQRYLQFGSKAEAEQSQ